MNTFVTGAIYKGLQRWAKIDSTAKTATFCLLRWSVNLADEEGVMHLTDETVKVHLNKHGTYYKKPFGVFREDSSMKITVKPATP
jgi:hypothetical protein